MDVIADPNHNLEAHTTGQSVWWNVIVVGGEGLGEEQDTMFATLNPEHRGDIPVVQGRDMDLATTCRGLIESMHGMLGMAADDSDSILFSAVPVQCIDSSTARTTQQEKVLFAMPPYHLHHTMSSIPTASHDHTVAINLANPSVLQEMCVSNSWRVVSSQRSQYYYW
ncbi:hypothetical protein EON65_26965 [archaeon]|nr:MAG: hypothetical protein EON65_26965 [archaeon]